MIGPRRPSNLDGAVNTLLVGRGLLTFFDPLRGTELGLESDGGTLVLRDVHLEAEVVPQVLDVHIEDLLGEEAGLQTSRAGEHFQDRVLLVEGLPKERKKERKKDQQSQSNLLASLVEPNQHCRLDEGWMDGWMVPRDHLWHHLGDEVVDLLVESFQVLLRQTQEFGVFLFLGQEDVQIVDLRQLLFKIAAQSLNGWCPTCYFWVVFWKMGQVI